MDETISRMISEKDYRLVVRQSNDNPNFFYAELIKYGWDDPDYEAGGNSPSEAIEELAKRFNAPIF